MPTYEYRCPQGHDFEKFFSRISESTSELECPECGQVAERRISGGGGLLFKGSGFYLTDYGRNAHRKAAPEKKDAAASRDSSGTSGDKGGEGGKGGKGGESGSGGGGMKAGEAGSSGGATDKSSGRTGGGKASSGGGSTGGTGE